MHDLLINMQISNPCTHLYKQPPNFPFYQMLILFPQALNIIWKCLSFNQLHYNIQTPTFLKGGVEFDNIRMVQFFINSHLPMHLIYSVNRIQWDFLHCISIWPFMDFIYHSICTFSYGLDNTIPVNLLEGAKLGCIFKFFNICLKGFEVFVLVNVI